MTNVSSPIARQFTIYDECTGKKPASELPNCVIDGDTVMPTGLKVKDSEKVYTLETGSARAILRNCPSSWQLDDASSETQFASESVNMQSTSTSHLVLKTEIHPYCSADLTPPHGDGLIGVSPALDGDNPYDSTNITGDLHAFMNQQPKGQRRLVVDKNAGTVCFGSACDKVDGLTSKDFSPINKFVMMPSFMEDGKKYVLDTGSTNSISYDKNICIVGNREIRALDIDYDSASIKIDVDMDTVKSRCANHALLR